MPAPLASVIEANLTAALLPDYPKVTMDGDKRVIDPTQLQPDMAKIVKGLATGIANTWTQWQMTQAVGATGAVPPPGALP